MRLLLSEVPMYTAKRLGETCPDCIGEREFFINNLLVRIHFIIVIIRWTGLAPWGFER